MNCCAEDHDIDNLLNEEEEVTFFESIRAKRLQELACCSVKSVSTMDSSDTWGFLAEMNHEKEVLHLSTTLPRLVIHFYNPSFKNCQLLNEHLHVTNKRYSTLFSVLLLF